MERIIAEARRAQGLSQEELAERLHVSRELVSKWETGRRRPDPALVEALAAILTVDPAVLRPDERLLDELWAELPVSLPLSADALTGALNGFLASLPARDADLFVRRYYFEDRPGDLAVRFSLREGTVRVKLHRLRRRLARYLERSFKNE